MSRHVSGGGSGLPLPASRAAREGQGGSRKKETGSGIRRPELRAVDEAESHGPEVRAGNRKWEPQAALTVSDRMLDQGRELTVRTSCPMSRRI